MTTAPWMLTRTLTLLCLASLAENQAYIVSRPE